MGTKTAKTNEAATQETKNYKLSAKITKVMQPTQDDNRISFVLDKEFTTCDTKTGEEVTTNIFGLNVYNVVQQVAQFVPFIQLADTLAMGKPINPQIIALSMVNADVELVREYHLKGEMRKTGNEPYSENCYTTEITKVTPHINDLFVQTLNGLIATQPARVQIVNVNPFNI